MEGQKAVQLGRTNGIFSSQFLGIQLPGLNQSSDGKDNISILFFRNRGISILNRVCFLHSHMLQKRVRAIL